MSAQAQPAVTDRAIFQAELDALRARGKAHTREGDAIAAGRRRLPMVEIDPAIPLTGPDFMGWEMPWTTRRGAEAMDYSYAQNGTGPARPGRPAFGRFPQHGRSGVGPPRHWCIRL